MSIDILSSLPTDHTDNEQDLKLINQLFPQKEVKNLMDENKQYMLLFVLFIVLSHEKIDELIKHFTKQQNWLVITVIKAIILVVVYFVYNNLHKVIVK